MAEKKEDKKLVVLGAYVAIFTDDGRRVCLNRGAEVGAGFDKDDIARLKEMDLVGEQTEDVVPGVGAAV